VAAWADDGAAVAGEVETRGALPLGTTVFLAGPRSPNECQFELPSIVRAFRCAGSAGAPVVTRALSPAFAEAATPGSVAPDAAVVPRLFVAFTRPVEPESLLKSLCVARAAPPVWFAGSIALWVSTIRRISPARPLKD